MQINQIGRSMVEMLGVLAIIGVLSIGSISGYSTAMRKYKLNRQAESFNMLLANAIQISASVNRSSNYTHYNDLLQKVQLIPDGIVYLKKPGYNSPDQLQDVFGNQIRFFSLHNLFYLSFILHNSPYSKDICRNIINIVKEHSSNITEILREDSSAGNYESNRIRSDCSKGVCFKNLTLEQIDKMCKISDKGNSTYLFGIRW